MLRGAHPASALHKESPPAYRITDGPSHPHPQTRSWGNWFAFVASEDLANTGNNRQEIFFFNLAFFDCFQGTTFATTPCPVDKDGKPVHTPFLQQATNGAGAPDNPSLSLPFAENGKLIRVGSGSPNNGYVCQNNAAGVQCTVSHWLAFDATGNFLGETDYPAAGRRQIYIKNLVNNEIRRITAGTDGDSVRPVINAHGGVVTFQSTATLLPTSPTGPGFSQIYVYEVKSRLLRQLTFGRASSTDPIPDEFAANIAFQSTANLLGNGSETGISQIFWAEYDKTTHTSVLHQLTHGNGPSQHPYISEIQPFIAFDSSATNLPGTSGTVGTSVFFSEPVKGPTQPPPLHQLTVPSTFGDCSHPMVDSGSAADHFGFICTGDPLRNATIGNRVFVFEQSTSTLMQITGTGDVQPPIGGSLGAWFLTMSTTSPLGGATKCGYQLAVVDYLGTNQCCHDPKWIPAVQIGQLPPDVLPPTTPGGGTSGSNLIGKQNFTLLKGDSSGAGSHALISTRDGATDIPLVGIGVIPLVIGGADEFFHQASISVPAKHLVLPPAPQADGTRLCIIASGDGGGLIDCDGKDPGGDVRVAQFHDAVSQGQVVDTPGTFAAGGMRLSIPVTVNIETRPGVNGYCGPTSAGDEYLLPASIPATLWLTTGQSETDIMDVDGNAGLNLTATATGAAFNCGALQAGTMASAELVGGIPLLAFPQAGTLLTRDTIISLHLRPVPDTQSCRQACTADADCNDGNPCNGVETCPNGFCVPGTPIQCPGDPCVGFGICDPATGICGPGKPCNDGNPCNGVETCTLQTGCQPGTPIDCSGSNACVSVNGAPAYAPGTCDPFTGLCSPGTPVLCDDGNPCTTDSCDPVAGCGHVNNTGTCDDGNGCTTGDTCVNGVCTGTVRVCDDASVCNGLESCDPTTGACVAGLPPVCDDGNPCTTDTCDQLLGCLFTNNASPCDDGNLCTRLDTCQNGTCAGTPVNCSDGNVCNGIETCNPLTGLCQGGSPLVCNDGNVCTTDSCDPVAGCTYVNNTNPCDDGSACTTGDVCQNGGCTGTPVNCSDGNACNGIETCDALTGCIPGTPLNCDDGNPCTTDSCDPILGCVHTVTGSGTVCLIGSLTSALTKADPALLGGPRLRDQLQQRVQKVQNLLTKAAATHAPKTAAKRYQAAFHGLERFQQKVRKGIFRWNFDVTLANEIIGQATDVMTAVKSLAK